MLLKILLIRCSQKGQSTKLQGKYSWRVVMGFFRRETMDYPSHSIITSTLILRSNILKAIIHHRLSLKLLLLKFKAIGNIFIVGIRSIFKRLLIRKIPLYKTQSSMRLNIALKINIKNIEKIKIKIAFDRGFLS